MDDAWEAWKAAKQARHARFRTQNTAVLEASGLLLDFRNGGETILFRQPGKPRCDFFPSTGRWRVAGRDETFNGGAEAFLGWYRKQ